MVSSTVHSIIVGSGDYHEARLRYVRPGNPTGNADVALPAMRPYADEGDLVACVMEA